MTRPGAGLLVIALLAPALAQAQLLYLPDDSSRLPESARAAGMGGAGAGVVWGDAPDAWANPAFVALQPGLRFAAHGSAHESGPDVADARWGGTRWGASAFGLGVSVGDASEEYGVYTPPDSTPGAVRTDLGETRVRSIAGAVSLHGLVRARHGPRGPRRWWWWLDAGFGVARREVESRATLSPTGDATLADWGGYVRWTPFVDRADAESDGHRVDIAYGHSVLNWRNDVLRFQGTLAGTQSLPRTQRDGVAVRYAYRRGVGAGLPGTLRAPLNAGLDPAFEVTLAWDVERVAPTAGRSRAHDATRTGAELAVMRLFALRVGQVDSPAENRAGVTWGFGVSLPLGRVAGARWDWASEPLAAGDMEDRETRQAMAAWVDPVAWWQGRRPRPE